MAELNKTSKGIILNGRGENQRDPAVKRIQSRVVKDYGSTVKAKFSDNRENYVSAHKMTRISQSIGNTSVRYYPDEVNNYGVKILKSLWKFLKIVLVCVIALFLFITFLNYQGAAYQDLGVAFSMSLEQLRDFIRYPSWDIIEAIFRGGYM